MDVETFVYAIVIITKGLIYVLARVLVFIISKKRGFENRCTKSAGLSR